MAKKLEPWCNFYKEIKNMKEKKEIIENNVILSPLDVSDSWRVEIDGTHFYITRETLDNLKKALNKI